MEWICHNHAPNCAYFRSFIFSPLGARWGHTYSMVTDYKVKWGQNIFSVYCRHDRFSKNRYLKTGVWRHRDAMIITSLVCYDVTLRGITAFHKRFPFYMKACMIYMNEVTCYIFVAVSHWCFSIVMSNCIWVIICVTHKLMTQTIR